MKNLSMVVAFVIVLGVVGVLAYNHIAQQNASPSSLAGEYALSTGGQALVEVTSEGGGYYIAFFKNNGVADQRVAAIPMSTDDQMAIGGNTVNLYLVGLKSTQGTFMIFRVNEGFKQWGKTFSTGYGSYGGPYSSGVEVLNKIR